MGCGLSTPKSSAQNGAQAGAQDAAQPADPASQVMGDVQQAVGLIDGIYQLVAPAILESKNKRNERDELKRLIGPWWDQAFQGGRCRIPVLDIDRFEAHLQRTNGVLTPRGKCTADSPWGYFLHALAIHPEDDILTWKPAVGAPWDMRGDTLALDVRGRVFCHLVNLYGVEAAKTHNVWIDGKQGEQEKRTGCRLSFGWLTWSTPDADHSFASFEPDTMHKLEAAKIPLQQSPTLLGLTLWKSYEAAWATGDDISDPGMAWPNPQTATLHMRLQCLDTNMQKVKYNSDGLILTQRWLSKASSVRRRAMTNGGKDNRFLESAYTVLVNHPQHSSLSDYDKRYSKQGLEACFSSNEDFTLRFRNPQAIVPSPPNTLGMGPIGPDVVLEATLKTYSHEDVNSWKGQLYAARELVVIVACMDRTIECVHPGSVRILDFAQGDPLWEARVHL